MADQHFPTRLWHDGRSGIARHAGVEVELHALPQLLPRVQLIEIDYAPTVRVQRVRESGQAWRDLSRDDALRVQQFLDAMAAAARAAIPTCSPWQN